MKISDFGKLPLHIQILVGIIAGGIAGFFILLIAGLQDAAAVSFLIALLGGVVSLPVLMHRAMVRRRGGYLNL